MSAIQLPPLAGQTTLESGFLDADEAALIVADRSTLDDCASCPRQAAYKRDARVLSTTFAMESGSQAHEAISQAVADYVESRGAASRQDTEVLIQQGAADSRPDVQPDVIQAVRPSIYGIAKYLHDIHFGNILRYDGGRGDHSGQLSWDIPEFGIRVTSEIDLLHAGPAPEVIHEVDWKSGHERWTSDKVAEAFQFQLHGWLILKNYPEVKAVDVRIWNTRLNSVTYSVLFKRTDLYAFENRIRNAARNYANIQGKTPEECRAWPTVSKCEYCPAVSLCDASRLPEGTPEEWVDKLVSLEAQADGIRKQVAAHVKKTGRDIVTASGNCFGSATYKSRPTMKTYQSGKAAEEAE